MAETLPAQATLFLSEGCHLLPYYPVILLPLMCAYFTDVQVSM